LRQYTDGSSLSLGCFFQLWAYSWAPAPCVDLELNAEFLRLTVKEDLGYFLDFNGTQRLDMDMLLTGDLDQFGVDHVYSVWGYHYWHCAFHLRKFFRATSGLTDTDRTLKHAVHCEQWLSDPFRFDWHKINIKVPLEFDTCNPNDFGGIEIEEAGSLNS
jgi:hypothetical protein